MVIAAVVREQSLGWLLLALLLFVAFEAGALVERWRQARSAREQKPVSRPGRTHKRRLIVMLELKPGGSFPLSVLTEPPNTRLDTGDVLPVWTTSDESVINVTPDHENPLRAVAVARNPGDFVISVSEADADLDAGETRLLAATFAGRVIAPEAEAQSISIEAGEVTYPAAPPVVPGS